MNFRDTVRQFFVEISQWFLYNIVMAIGFAASLVASGALLCYCFWGEFRSFADYYYWQTSLVLMASILIAVVFLLILRYLDQRWPYVRYW